MILDELRDQFLAGKQGDCSLLFSCDGVIVHRRKAYRLMVDKLDYVRSQYNFSEGVDKGEIHINITDFYDTGSKTSAEDFVVASLSCCVGAHVNFENFDLPTRYGVVRFRDFMGLCYKELFFTGYGGSGELPEWRIAMFADPAVPEEVTSAIVDALCCSTQKIQECIIETDLHFLGFANTDEGQHCKRMQWEHTWDIIEKLENKDVELCRKVCFHQIKFYMECFPTDFWGSDFGPDMYAVSIGFGKRTHSTLGLFLKLIGPPDNEKYPKDFFKKLRQGYHFHLQWNRCGVFYLNPAMNVEHFSKLPYIEEMKKISDSDCPHELQAKLQVLRWTRSFYGEEIQKYSSAASKVFVKYIEWVSQQITSVEEAIGYELYHRCLDQRKETPRIVGN